MPKVTAELAEQALNEVLPLHRGPGGAVAILQNGEVLAQRVWGFADVEQRIPFAPDTRFPICSITKQFLCLLLEYFEQENPGFIATLDHDLTAILPENMTKDYRLNVQHLCDMQSGLRDYYALATLWGTQTEGRFRVAKEATESLKHMKSFHFEPGTMFSYSNINFHILGRLLEKETGWELGALIREHILKPANMKTAEFCPDNAKLPPPCIGYEGNEQNGYYPAVNNMEWSGDAGLVASLEDMIAYEQYFDQSWTDNTGLPSCLSHTPEFKDRTPAMYGSGLSHAKFGDITSVGHGGSLRGYQLHRRYVPSERLSVFVMFNYQNEAQKANHTIIAKLLGTQTTSSVTAAPGWQGMFYDPDAQLVYEAKPGDGKGKVVVDGETLKLTEPTQAQSYSTTASIDQDKLRIHFLADNRSAEATRIAKRDEDRSKMGSIIGTYHCAELESTFHCSGMGEVLYGSFDGYLGNGPVHLMRWVGGDIWTLANSRGLDTPAPGKWTVVFERDAHDTVTGVVIGCWLARKLKYVKKISADGSSSGQ